MKKRVLLIILLTSICIALCACGSNKKTVANSNELQQTTENEIIQEIEEKDTLGNEVEIEITLENWQDYFEPQLVFYVKEEYNAFDELVAKNIEYDYCYTIKDKYEINVEKSNVAIEVNYHTENWYVNVNTDTLEISYIEKINDLSNLKDQTYKFEQLYSNKEPLDNKLYYGVDFGPWGEPDYIWFNSNPTYIMNEEPTISEDTNKELPVATMNKWVVDEVVRIQGIIYVKEK